ncbi:hypothetical protein C6Y14_07070 [Streptomyces dioscori]|uniref:Uncharacterized protein n=2 Tax=Streptomyces dioscori TaxID=2109333 RepID=A0A2P8QD01_9ACTN|nr:hypothetical protein C6Y14_07070 [Streptomyces dioscori]
MIEIDTFLRGADGGFVPVASCTSAPADLDYVEGAIRLTVDGQEVIGLEEWDYVDQLWAYIADMVTQLHSSGHAQTHFPDQPIKLSFETTGTRVLVTVKAGAETKRASAPAEEFVRALKKAGLVFFGKMNELAPGVSHHEAVRALSA